MNYDGFIFAIQKESTFLKFDSNLFISMVLWMSVTICDSQNGFVIIRSKDKDININFDNYDSAIDYIRRYENKNKRKYTIVYE